MIGCFDPGGSSVPTKSFENITWYQVCACGSACARRCMCQGTRVRNGLLLKLQVWDEKHPVPPQDELVIGDVLLEKPAWKPKPKPHVWKAVIFHQYWNKFRHKDWCSMILCFFPGDFLSYRLWLKQHFRGFSLLKTVMRWLMLHYGFSSAFGFGSEPARLCHILGGWASIQIILVFTRGTGFGPFPSCP